MGSLATCPEGTMPCMYVPDKLETYIACAGKGSEIGDFLTQHPAVNCISFTGGDTGISVSKKVSHVLRIHYNMPLSGSRYMCLL